MYAQCMQRIAGIKGNLQKNALLIYTFYGDYFYLWNGDADQFLKAIQDIKKGLITSKEAQIRLEKRIGKEPADEILSHLDSWD